MSEELNQEVEQQQENQVEQTQQEYSPVEEKALASGWRPKEEYEGDPDKWVDADEFVRRAPLFEKIDVVGKELRESRKVIKALQEHLAKVREGEYKRALSDLRAEKKIALEEGDADRLIEIDEQIAGAKAAEQAEAQAQRQQASQPDPRFVQWVNNNQWYVNDKELRDFSDQVGMAYKNANPHLGAEEVLEYTTKRVLKAFPDKFKNERRARVNSVEGASSPSTKKTQEYQLDEVETQVMNRLVRSGAMTKEQYIADLRKAKGN